MEGEIDYRKIYMTKIDHKHTRVGKDYQAVIPEFKPKDKKANNLSDKNQNKDLKQLTDEHKAHYIYNKEDERDDPLTPNKKRKTDEPEPIKK